LGTIGIDITVSGTNIEDTVLVMRDYTKNKNGESETLGMVSIYRYNSRNFQKVADITNKLAGSSSTWQNEDWFGVGMHFAMDNIETNGVLHVSAPKRSEKVFRLTSKSWKQWDEWAVDGAFENPIRRDKSFFGGTMDGHPNGAYLMVADAISANGRGMVYLIHRRHSGEAILGFEDEVRGPMENATYTYDWIGTFAKENSTALSTYLQDQFGKSITSSGNVVIIGAPAEDCVYTFNRPLPCMFHCKRIMRAVGPMSFRVTFLNFRIGNILILTPTFQILIRCHSRIRSKHRFAEQFHFQSPSSNRNTRGAKKDSRELCSHLCNCWCNSGFPNIWYVASLNLRLIIVRIYNL
jgi:hypothetical protein